MTQVTNEIPAMKAAILAAMQGGIKMLSSHRPAAYRRSVRDRFAAATNLGVMDAREIAASGLMGEGIADVRLKHWPAADVTFQVVDRAAVNFVWLHTVSPGFGRMHVFCAHERTGEWRTLPVSIVSPGCPPRRTARHCPADPQVVRDIDAVCARAMDGLAMLLSHPAADVLRPVHPFAAMTRPLSPADEEKRNTADVGPGAGSFCFPERPLSRFEWAAVRGLVRGLPRTAVAIVPQGYLDHLRLLPHAEAVTTAEVMAAIKADPLPSAAAGDLVLPAEQFLFEMEPLEGEARTARLVHVRRIREEGKAHLLVMVLVDNPGGRSWSVTTPGTMVILADCQSDPGEIEAAPALGFAALRHEMCLAAYGLAVLDARQRGVSASPRSPHR